MSDELTVTVELCKRNTGLGGRFSPASVAEYRTVTREEAVSLLATKLENGFFWREMPEDRTGNG